MRPQAGRQAEAPLGAERFKVRGQLAPDVKRRLPLRQAVEQGQGTLKPDHLRRRVRVLRQKRLQRVARLRVQAVFQIIRIQRLCLLPCHLPLLPCPGEIFGLTTSGLTEDKYGSNLALNASRARCSLDFTLTRLSSIICSISS